MHLTGQAHPPPALTQAARLAPNHLYAEAKGRIHPSGKTGSKTQTRKATAACGNCEEYQGTAGVKSSHPSRKRRKKNNLLHSCPGLSTPRSKTASAWHLRVFPLLERQGRGVFFSSIFLSFLNFLSSVFLVFPRKTLFSYGFSGISLGVAWFFLWKTLFSYGFRVISLGFQKENIRYLGYSSGKSDFPDSLAFFRFSQGKHTLPWLFLGKIRFS